MEQQPQQQHVILRNHLMKIHPHSSSSVCPLEPWIKFCGHFLFLDCTKPRTNCTAKRTYLCRDWNFQALSWTIQQELFTRDKLYWDSPGLERIQILYKYRLLFLWPLPLEEGVMTTNVSNNYSWSFVEGASFFVQALTAWAGLVDVGGMPDLTVESQTDKRPPPYIVLVHSAAGGLDYGPSYEALRRGGSLVTFGSTSYASPGLGLNPMRLFGCTSIDQNRPGELTSRNIRLAGFNLIYLTDQPAKLRSELTQCIRCLGGDRDTVWSAGPDLGLVTPPIVGQTLTFERKPSKPL
ncbi:hypothetical protein IV203_002679 [Nitzschia inconspicua]|uniref:Uncharacterized protein n=1 Tax=Nitzschia inconspicua TaxID=303405 RepID=A0A9K3K5D4_9STRA|nr:hypothetical protein IV203_002679 [Nitzschia inconspicua]